MTTTSSDTPRVILCEVGPRDGLQSEKRLWSIDERIELVDRLSQTGMPRIEAVSFVNPKRVPQMADPEQVMAGITRRADILYCGLALNARGVERALAAGVDLVRYAVAASETFNRKNQGVSVDETLDAFAVIADAALSTGNGLSATVATAFGCPFEGEVALDQLLHVTRRLAEAGATEILLADTIGCAVPTQVSAGLAAVAEALGPDIPLGVHLHNTRNTGFANAAAAIQAGIRLLDSSVAGIGGCPFAPRATGNIASEDLCYMLRQMGYGTGVHIEALMDVARWTEQVFDRPLPGLVMKAGLFPEVARGG